MPTVTASTSMPTLPPLPTFDDLLDDDTSKHNPRDQPCPTCKQENKLTPEDVRQGYQCDDCADAQEGGC